MAKKVGINYDKEHFKRIESYVRKIQLLYLRTGQQAAQLVEGVKYKGEFSFDKFPAVKKKIDKLIGEMNTTMELSIQQMNKTEWMEACYKGDALIAQYASKINIPTTLLERYQSRNMEALAAFQQRKINGLNLSDRVWRYTNQFKGELELALDIGLGEGRSAAQLSRDVRSYLNNPDALFRRVRNKYGNLKLSKHAKQYHPGPGVYRSAYKNAMRLTRTETNMAYRKADYEKNQQFDFVVGIEVKRSNHFFSCPVCESLKGRYPKSFVFTGWHPQCRCFCVSILATQEEFIQHQKKLLAGEESVLKSKKEVKGVPEGFKKWVKDNQEKSDSKPYFLKDNESLLRAAR